MNDSIDCSNTNDLRFRFSQSAMSIMSQCPNRKSNHLLYVNINRDQFIIKTSDQKVLRSIKLRAFSQARAFSNTKSCQYWINTIPNSTKFSIQLQHIRNSTCRSIRTAIAIFLCKLRLGLSNDLLAIFFHLLPCSPCKTVPDWVFCKPIGPSATLTREPQNDDCHNFSMISDDKIFELPLLQRHRM